MQQFQAEVQLPRARSEVFDYIRRPANIVNLLAASASNLEYKVPEVLAIGSNLEFWISTYGMRIELVYEVINFTEDERITLTQLRGPFRHWTHEFGFSDEGPQQALMTERVQFEGPGGFLGMMVTNKAIMEQLQSHIPYGHDLLRKHLATPGTA